MRGACERIEGGLAKNIAEPKNVFCPWSYKKVAPCFVEGMSKKGERGVTSYLGNFQREPCFTVRQ